MKFKSLRVFGIILLALFIMSMSECGRDKVEPPTEEPTDGGGETNDDIGDPLVAENVKHLRTLEPAHWCYSVAFSRDGNIIAGGFMNGDDTIVLWNAKTGTRIRTLVGHTGDVWSVAFSPIKNTLASMSNGDEGILLWNANTGAIIGKQEFENGGWSVAFSPDGNMIAGVPGSRNGVFYLWNADTGAHIRTFKGQHTGPVRRVAFSPDGRRIASAGLEDASIVLWSRNGAHIRTLKGHTGGVNSVAFSPDGKTLASTSSDKTIRLWNPNTGAHIETLGHMKDGFFVVFSPDGKTLASADWNIIRLWNSNTGALLNKLEEHTDIITGLAFSPDGKTIASASKDKTIRLWGE